MEIKSAAFSYIFWRGVGARGQIDDALEPYLKIPPVARKHGFANWVRDARIGRELSQKTVAERMNISVQSFASLESGVDTGKISIKRLQQVANALDCEFIYVIRPKSGMPFSLETWNKLLEVVKPKVSREKCHNDRQYLLQLSAAAKRLYRDHKFRQQQGWSERVID